MKDKISYQSTIYACYIGNFVQAAVVNLTPILFIPLREQFGLTYTQFGLLILANFITQVLFDILFSKAVDRHGFRPFIVSAHVLCVIGFVLFALAPVLFKGSEFMGFLTATIIFSGSGGLLELLLSPIVDAIPTDEKEKAMTMLHSFYAWGQVTVVLLTTLFIFFFKGRSWHIIVLLWAIVPFFNIFLFSKVPLAQKVHESQMMKVRHLIRNPVFILAFFAIACGGASEITMAQWTSAFMEKGLGLPKIMGDALGLCGFAFMLGIGRVLYGMYGSKINIHKVMLYGSLLTALCYIVVALSPSKSLSLTACILSGIGVSLLWPGTLIVASQKLPLAGASMFALLSAGGDLGASVGPWFTGVITDAVTQTVPFSMIERFSLSGEQFGLRIGLFISILFPLGSLIFHWHLKTKVKKV
ncbi:MAG: major facilitator superfamily 1 [Clostridia bacterium]|jgi:fucose permease|nr:major facilitator superfamily 1 [Clostridia bacterium]